MILVLCAGLTACGGDPSQQGTTSPQSTVESTAETTPSPTPTETPTETASTPTSATATPTSGVTVEYVCEGQHYSTMEEAWAGEHPNCIDTKAFGEPNRREAAAVRLAYGPTTKITPRLVGILYGSCGSNSRWWPGVVKNETVSAAAAQEQTGANLLCPTHPHMDRAKAYLERSLRQAEKDKNRIQYDGTYVVGTELNPGTYVANPNGPCYWERTDANGEIIDNNFSNGARMQFTARPSDYSVSVQGCGEWHRLE